MLHNLATPRGFEQELLVHFAFNTWQAEGQWHARKPSQSGFIDNGNFTCSAASFNSLGTWSTQKYLPIGLVENQAAGCDLVLANRTQRILALGAVQYLG